ncbi:MAG: hypothetical protein QXT73_02315 [Candidatus Methanomethylicaceae archaeon]
MIVLIPSCVRIEYNTTIPLCGYCCGALDFTRDDWILARCKYLHDGLCSCYQERPTACKFSPFFDYTVEEAAAYFGPHSFVVPWCSYRKTILDYLGVPYVLVRDAEEAIAHYKRAGLGDFRRRSIKWFRRRSVILE